jgi:hypothetical protein
MVGGSLAALVVFWFILVPIGLGLWWFSQPVLNASDLATLIKALPSLWWPLIVVVGLVLFRTDLASALRRIRKWTGLGNTLELDPERIETLKQEVKEAEAEQNAQPQPPAPGGPATASSPASNVDANELYELASRDYRLAIARLAMAIEAALTEVTKELGWIDRRRESASVLWSRLVRVGLVSPTTLSSLREFWSVRNEIFHGRNVELSREAIAALLESGLALLRIIKSAPSRMFTVVQVVDLYTDSTVDFLANDVRGVILRTSGENPENVGPYPTTRLYKPGVRVSWAWNREREYGPMWYRDAAGQVRKAFDRSFEFVGTELTLRKSDPGIHPGLYPDSWSRSDVADEP